MGKVFCTHCGNPLPENALVCPNCGNNVNPHYQQPQQQYQNGQQNYQGGQQNYQNGQQNYQGGQQNYQNGQQPYQGQPQYRQPYYQQPNQGGGNKGLLYAIIGVLAALLIGGAIYYFVNKNSEESAQLELLKQQQEELATKNQELAEKNEKLEEENAKKADTKIIVQKQAEHAAEHRAVSAGGGRAKVVINGTGVRLRFAPSLNAGYLTWANGQTRAPKKGARLEYTGEDGDWYQVSYLGHTFYVSKEFSYLEY